MLVKCPSCDAECIEIESRQGDKLLVDPAMAVYKITIAEKPGGLDGKEVGEPVTGKMIYAEHRCEVKV